MYNRSNFGRMHGRVKIMHTIQSWA